MSVAIIDCGTNSTRLLIVDNNGTTLVREMTITRLGEGVAATGTLSAAALERVATCLRGYRNLMDRHDVTNGRLVATSAARDASNGAEFLALCESITGLPTALLTGEEEATASLLGATADLSPSALPTMIVDIGGGSTELACRLEGDLLAYSMQLGCVRVTEQTLMSGPVSDAMIAKANVMITEELQRAFHAVPKFEDLVGRVRLVGLAGTVATIAALDVGMTTYDRALVHHRRLTLEGITAWRERLAGESASERLARPGMVSGREDVLVGGLLVLEAVMRRFAINELVTSECDILDGVAQQLLLTDPS